MANPRTLATSRSARTPGELKLQVAVDIADKNLYVRTPDAIEARGQRVSTIMQPVNGGDALPP